MVETLTVLGTLAGVAAAVIAYLQLRRTPPTTRAVAAVENDATRATENAVLVAGGTNRDLGSPIGHLMAIDEHSLLEPYLPAAQRLVGLVPKQGFHFLIVSGCSSAGKDVLVAEVLRRVGTGAEMLKKYMTRSRRAGEPDYSMSVTSSQFEKAERAGKIIFPYHKRDCDYGFDADDFVSAAKHGICKIAIFTELNAVPRIVKALRANGFLATPVFIDVERAYLVRRSYHRNLGLNEVQKRLESVDQDLNALASRTTPLEHDYYVVRNNEGEPFNSAKNNLEGLMRLAIAGDLSWPPPPNKALHPTVA